MSTKHSVEPLILFKPQLQLDSYSFVLALAKPPASYCRTNYEQNREGSTHISKTNPEIVRKYLGRMKRAH
jgi:hypothetical protein